MTLGNDIVALDALVFRCPIEKPIVTSFGVMRDRPAVFLRVRDIEGATGWGEVWCNFPVCGAEHRARLVASTFAPLLVGRTIDDPRIIYRELTLATEVLAIQSGEAGPIAQCIAGIDLALWDLKARCAGKPLWRFLGGTSADISVYASGINPDEPEAMALAKQDEGYRAFKVKVGFGEDRDVSNVSAVRAAIAAGSALMVDANQDWDLETAIRMARRLQEHRLEWLEEPLRADRPTSEWKKLASCVDIALAGGENLASDEAFNRVLASRTMSVIQPDLSKWGGISAGLPLARRIAAAGSRFCPHFLGGGIGLLASAHLLAATGANGALEVDSNPNPLRSLTCGALNIIRDGRTILTELPGIGFEPDLDELQAFAVQT